MRRPAGTSSITAKFGSSRQSKNAANEALQKETQKAAAYETLLQESVARERELRHEVAGLKQFLNTYDDSDSTEIDNDLSTINYLIHDFASNVSFDQEWSPDPSSAKSPETVANVRKQLARFLSPPFLQALADSNHHDTQATPTIFRYAIQTALVQQVAGVLGGFCCGLDESLDQLLRRMSEATRFKEIQPVYGRWRSLLHESARSALIPNESSEYIRKLVKDAATSAYLCGCLIHGRPAAQEQFEIWYKKYRSGIRDIFDNVVQMSTRFRERIITRDYQPYTAINHPFNPQRADLAQPVASPLANDMVVGCIKLGLTFIRKPGREQTDLQETIWRTPQVVTVSMLNQLVTSSREGFHSSRTLSLLRSEVRAPDHSPPKNWSSLVVNARNPNPQFAANTNAASKEWSTAAPQLVFSSKAETNMGKSPFAALPRGGTPEPKGTQTPQGRNSPCPSGGPPDSVKPISMGRGWSKVRRVIDQRLPWIPKRQRGGVQ